MTASGSALTARTRNTKSALLRSRAASTSAAAFSRSGAVTTTWPVPACNADCNRNHALPAVNLLMMRSCERSPFAAPLEADGREGWDEVRCLSF
jgi:hypothetical protein